MTKHDKGLGASDYRRTDPQEVLLKAVTTNRVKTGLYSLIPYVVELTELSWLARCIVYWA